MTSAGRRSTLAQCVLVAVCILLVLGAIDAALAQPLGMTRIQAPTEIGGITGWILAKQAEFYRMMSGTIRAAKADGSAAWTLMGISFLYGIFHAAGPGHGKAVISSYLVAHNETWRRGGAAQRHRQDHGQRRPCHRNRQLRADRADRPAAALGERPRLHRPAAR